MGHSPRMLIIACGSDTPFNISRQMMLSKTSRFTRRRTFVSTLFTVTFFASMLTVSASNILPCPARPDKSRFTDSDMEQGVGGSVKVAKRPRRWIEERLPT